MTKTHWILAAIFGVAIFYFLVLDSPSLVGKPLPQFNLQTTEQKPFTNQDLKGKNTLIYFYGEGCSACKMVGPEVDRLAKKYPADKLQVVAAEVWNDSPAQADQLKRRSRASYTFVSGATGLSQELKIEGVPTVLLVDPQGKIVQMSVGYDKSRSLDQLVKSTFNL